ncbi:MAG: hypothetical protein K2J82_07850 [Muribaculaceae bacterium]|nr:hypothetical protein [Muribaculaceae bacterium]
MDYIKAPEKVARLCGQAQNRGQLPDGNYILWERDLLRLQPYDLDALGCLGMTAAEVREEQAGGEPRELPEPTDPRVAETVEESEE